ncbi:MAG: DUF4012 domain-containing protein [Pseudomonadales bacterium]|jgi:hypothetical protein|nr:DUF4012 domain-containing protein [Pseudomonadales bacterium]
MPKAVKVKKSKKTEKLVEKVEEKNLNLTNDEPIPKLKTEDKVGETGEAKEEKMDEKLAKKTELKKKPKKPFKMKRWGWTLLGVAALMVVLFTAGVVVGNSYRRLTSNFLLQAQITMDSALAVNYLFQNQNMTAVIDQMEEVREQYEVLERIFWQYEGISWVPGLRQYFQDGQTLFAAGHHGLDAADKALAAVLPHLDVLGLDGRNDEEYGCECYEYEEGEDYENCECELEQRCDSDDEQCMLESDAYHCDYEEGYGHSCHFITTEDRIVVMLNALSAIGPELDGIMESLTAMNDKINMIDPSIYPDTIGDIPFATSYLRRQGREEWAELPLRDSIVEIQAMANLATEMFIDYRPVIEKIPRMAGATGERMKYLILFQNDNELRPTGGFLTAYAIIYVEDGKISLEKSDDIYELDRRFNSRIPIPEQLGRYLTTERYWHLRDKNISPDLVTSMGYFLESYRTMESEPQDIDGIILIDTFVLTELMRVLGPVEVPGYGTFTAENCPEREVPQVVVALSEIITRPTPFIREDRKGILGPMMQILLSMVYTAPRQSMPDLFQVGLRSLEGRHVQVYFMDEDLQAAAERINIAGRMVAPTDGSDFFGIVDANLGGAKSNLFITHEVEHTVFEPVDGRLERHVRITYRNHRPGDNCDLEAGLLCLNATNNNWHRLYLPLGSELISTRGFRGDPLVYEENGFTVIDGFFSLDPDSIARVEVNYTVPFTISDTYYQLHIWKQGGVESVRHLVDIDGYQHELYIRRDTNFRAPFRP